MKPSAPLILDELVVRQTQGGGATEDLLDAACGKLGIARLDENGPADFLRGLHKGPEGDLIASALLRVLAGRYDAIDRSQYRTQIAEFLDGQYAQDLRAHYRRPRRLRAYDVLNALAPVAPALEGLADDAVHGFTHLDALETYRQLLFKTLNSSAGKVLLRPFLPQIASGEALSKLFSDALSFRGAEEGDAPTTALMQLDASFEALEAMVEQQPTVYARRILGGAVDTLRRAAREQRQMKSPPASLSFTVMERPLPLLEPGVSCDVEIAVVNDGESVAENVELRFETEDAAVIAFDQPLRLERIEPNTRRDITVPLIVREPAVSTVLSLKASWTNHDHTIGRDDERFALRAHEIHIEWADLETREPFAPYPVDNADQLVGRERQLATLKNYFSVRPFANLYVTGQRRIGKTSLVRVLMTELRGHPSTAVASVEMGEVRANGGETVGGLGRKLAERAIRAAGLDGEIEVPAFSDSLAPLTDVVDQIAEWDDALSFVFVIDEFDELPPETYRRDGPGDALFVPMRSLAQKPNVGWVLVGGEKMPFIRDEQAARLNTFREVSVDYLALGSTNENRDFAGLVRGPLPADFVVDDAAIRAVHAVSAGNPHFAKEICASMFARAVTRRDAVVGSKEIRDAVDSAARERDVELFAHFWEDGIFEVDAERRRRELARRTFLIACAESLRTANTLDNSRIATAAEARGLARGDAERLRTEFVRRGILLESGSQRLRVKVPFFQRWLETEGIYRLPPRGISEQVGQVLADEEARLRVSGQEIRRLVASWEQFSFRGQRVTRDQVEDWLDQFETVVERRIAFRLLERFKVVSDAEVHDGFRRLHRLAVRDTETKIRRGQRTLTNFLVSAIGDTGSSGDSFAYSYRQANNIHTSNVVRSAKLIERLNARHDVTSVVLVDDFVGSGGTAVGALGPLAKQARQLSGRPPVNWFLFAVTGLPDGVRTISQSAPASELRLRVELAHPLSEADLPLHTDSTVFETPDEREAARSLMIKYGQRSGMKFPLGYSEQAALVTFSENCPNNAPGVIWSDAGSWRPLFRRTAS